jgi:hypothetical protein
MDTDDLSYEASYLPFTVLLTLPFTTTMSPLPAPGFSPPYLLSLNDVALIVLPRSVTKLEHDYVVQIFIKSEHKCIHVSSRTLL